MTHRAARLAETLKEEMAEIIQSELKDPRLGFATVTRVEVSNDLRYAKVLVSVYGSSEDGEATLSVLERAMGFIRSLLGRRLRLRYVPEISFKLDPSIGYGARVTHLLDELKKEGAAQDEQS
ncbi:MAG: 30S ribosome-binding factor RbfA [Bacillota bacterium]